MGESLGMKIADDGIRKCPDHSTLVTTFMSDRCALAGLKVGDRMHMLNGQALAGLNFDQVIETSTYRRRHQQLASLAPCAHPTTLD